MSLLNYDKALFGKITGVYDEVIFASPDESFKQNALKNDGRVLLPFISVWRLPEFTINRQTYNDSRVRQGSTLRLGTEANSPLRAARGVPVTLTYQLDVYSNKRTTCDGIASELILHLLEHPYINVNIDGLDRNFVQQFEIIVSDSVNDNTSVSEFEDTGRIYRLTLEITLNDAVIYRIDRHDNKQVEKVLVDIVDIDTNNVMESHIDVGAIE
jgi:hypothetical protein